MYMSIANESWWVQPMRNDVLLQHRLSLVEPLHSMIPDLIRIILTNLGLNKVADSLKIIFSVHVLDGTFMTFW